MGIFSIEEEKEIEAEVFLKGVIKILKTSNGLNPQSRKRLQDFVKDFEYTIKS